MLDELMLEAFAPVAADFRATGRDARLVEPDRRFRRPGVTARLVVGGEMLGALLALYPESAEDPARYPGMLAAQAQDAIDGAIRDRDGHVSPWPPCPVGGHGHPLSVDTNSGLWHCPLDPRVSAPVGHLANLLTTQPRGGVARSGRFVRGQ
jgi:hypothetical protein